MVFSLSRKTSCYRLPFPSPLAVFHQQLIVRWLPFFPLFFSFPSAELKKRITDPNFSPRKTRITAAPMHHRETEQPQKAHDRDFNLK